MGHWHWAAAFVLVASGASAQQPAEVAARARLEPLWRQVQAATRRPATWAARRAALAAETSLSPADRLASIEGVGEDLRREIAFARTVPGRLDRIGEGCIGPLRNCRLLAGGLLRAETGGLELRWQVQRGFTPEAGTLGGLVIYERRGRDFQPLTWSFEGYAWQAPRLIEREEGMLLAATGFRAGTGSGNADLLYRRAGHAWREVETESWQLALPRHLPAGLGVWKGVEYDFAGMTARMSLWRDDDANCCPTGGQALAELRVEGDRLVLVRVRRASLEDFPG